jgi:hypothetical protein
MFARLVEKIRRGWRLAKMAFRVLMTDKKLLLFPLFSFYALVLVLASFLVPLLLSTDFMDMIRQQNGRNLNNVTSNVLAYVLLFAFYFCNYFVIVFFNSALVACVLVRFSGEEPTLGDGFGAAFSRLPQILLWALLSASVGVLLKIISDRSPKVGKIVADLLGVVWGVMTYFVVPVLVVEKVGPFQAVKRSCKIMRKTWGETLVSNFGIGLIMFFLFLAALVPLFLCLIIGGVAVIIGLVISVTLILLLSLVSSALDTIIVAALYQYAALKETPRGFKEGVLSNAFAEV